MCLNMHDFDHLNPRSYIYMYTFLSTETWISSMPAIYFESLINTFKNVFIDQLNNNTNNPVSID